MPQVEDHRAPVATNGNGTEYVSMDAASAISPIAIVGIGLRLPGGVRSTEAFWDLLLSKRDVSVEVPEDRYNIDSFYSSDRPRMVKARRGFFLEEDFSTVDPSVGKTGARHQGLSDPQQRLLLEVVWECMENAGQTGWQGRDIGVYVGTFGDDSLELSLKDPLSLSRGHVLGVGDFYLSNCISHEYDLRGPSLTIKTACSASMVGLHEACLSVGSGRCSSAIVAGSSIMLSPTMTTSMSENLVLSPTGECRTFDADANGFARAEAVNAIYIKRLDDAIRDGDPIRAVIRSTATNCNGRATKMSIPSVEMQQELIMKAYQHAGINNIADTALFEAHGTGTQAGDAAETQAIAQAFGGQGVYISAVKPNVGHSEGASGLTSIIKAVLCLEKRMIPPNMRFNKPNPHIPFKEGKLRVAEELLPWPQDRKERVSINSFGIGGSNAHAILESASCYSGHLSCNGVGLDSQTPRLLVTSALSSASLKNRTKLLQEYCESGKVNPQDLAYTLSSRRNHERYRAFAVISSSEPEQAELGDFQYRTEIDPPPSTVVFVFPGQGTQWHGMGRELFESIPRFRADIRSLDKTLQSISSPPVWTLEEKLFDSGDPGNIMKAEYAQPLCAAIQIALVNLLASWNIYPTAVIGHSSGEMVAAYASKAITAEQAIFTAYCRGQVTKYSNHVGGMAAVGLGRDAIFEYLEEGVVIACENSPQNVVISGKDDILVRVLHRIKEEQPDTFTRRLDVEVAYHSHMMNEMGALLEIVMGDNDSPSHTPQVPMFSTVFGRAILKSDQLCASYWRKNLESPVLFSKAVQEAVETLGKGPSCFIEVGPRCPLSGPLRQIFQSLSHQPQLRYIPTLTRGQNQIKSIFETAGKLFLQGMPINLEAVLAAVNTVSAHILTDLPPYPWDYSQKLWGECSVSNSWRLRKHIHHELLGVRVLESSSIEPMWRNLLRVEESSWLIDHAFLGEIVFPGMGFVSIAGEAIRQLSSPDTGYEIRNLFIRHALVLDRDSTVEISTTLKPERLTDLLESGWHDFKICSKFNGQWTKHCTGQIRASQGPGTAASALGWPQYSRKVDRIGWYRYLKRLGLVYGPEFQGMSNITAHTTEAKATATVVAGENVPGVSTFPAHPTLLDSCLRECNEGKPNRRMTMLTLRVIELMTVAGSRGISRDKERFYIPLSIDSICIASCSGLVVNAQATMIESEYGHLIGNVSAILDGRTVIDICGLRSVAVETEENIRQDLLLCHIEWKPNIESLPSLEGLLETLSDDDSEIRLFEQMTILDIIWTYDKIKDIETNEPHLIKHRNWLADRVRDAESGHNIRAPEVQKWMKLSFEDQKAIYETLRGSFMDVVIHLHKHLKFLRSVFDHMPEVYEGSASSFEVVVDNDGWHDFHAYRRWASFEPFFSLLKHSRPNMKVLEVGAGTGTCTNRTLDYLHTDGNRRYSEYVYTDISSYFLSEAREKFSRYANLSFKTLDITEDPVEQGFEAAAYDLVICDNVLHATPSLKHSLENVRKLLAPGGYLLLAEISPEPLFTASIMGLLPGWWLGEADGRVDTPCVSKERWDKELRAAGFTGVETEAFDAEPPYHCHSFMISRASFIGNTETDVAFLYRAVPSKRATLVEDAFKRAGYRVKWFTLRETPPCQTVVSLLDLDEPFFYAISEDDFISFRNIMATSSVKSFLWLTQAIQLHCHDPRWGLTLGVARTMRIEFSLPFTTFEMDGCDESVLMSLIRVHQTIQSSIDSGVEPDSEYLADHDAILTSRYYPRAPTCRQAVMKSTKTLQKKLTIGTYALLDTLQWSQIESRTLCHDEVEVEIKVVGLNFRDMMTAMGYVCSKDCLGIEAVGVVRKMGSGPHPQDLHEGDRVVVLGEGLLRTVVIAKNTHCIKMPEDVSLEDAATISIVYSTVMCCLLEIGELEKGQSVLVHSACGGIGIAAIQVCKMVGAEIYATVGNENKKQYLIENYGIPCNRIFNSRDTSFKVGILKETSGLGVDIVLNSLSGEGLHASWDCVAAFGKMIEIGKRDIMGCGKLNMDRFLDNRSFHGFDLSALVKYRPQKVARLLLKAMEYIRDGLLKPIQPQNIFNAQNVQDAFRMMQTGQHLGKILIQMPEDTDEILSLPFQESVIFAADATYLLVGGLGGIGIAVSRWMVEKGARNLVFLCRSGGKDLRSTEFIQELEAMGCAVKVATGSVSQVDDVEAAIALSGARLAGIIQLAMTLRDESFRAMTYDDWENVLAPKVKGTNILYQALKNYKLDFFVAFGSVSGTYGNAGQANYAAANSYLDAFIKNIRLTGFPASVIDLSAVEDIGYVSQNEGILKRCLKFTQRLMLEDDVLKAVENAILECRSVAINEGCNIGLITMGPFAELLTTTTRTDLRFAAFKQTDLNITQTSETDTMKEWMAAVEDEPQILMHQEAVEFLTTEFSRVIGAYVGEDSADGADATAGDIAIDSLMAVEIHSLLRTRCRVQVPAVTLAKAKSVRGISLLTIHALKVKYNLEEAEKR